MKRFADPGHTDAKRPQKAMPYDDSPVHWMPLWSLTMGQQVYVPLSTCIGNLPFDERRFGGWHSNGCAAGNTLEEAILQGLFELIERDAAGIWWYNRARRPAFDLSAVDQQMLDTIEQTLKADYDYHVLDLTTDIGVPVMMAVGQHKANGGFCLGFGCHLHKELAALRALTELCQLLPVRDQGRHQFDFDDIEPGPWLQPCANAQLAAAKVESSEDISQDIEAVVDCLSQVGLETLVLNYSRADLPLKTARVVVPGLCHFLATAGQILVCMMCRCNWVGVIRH